MRAALLLIALAGCGHKDDTCVTYWTRSYDCKDKLALAYWLDTLHKPAYAFRPEKPEPRVRARMRCERDDDQVAAERAKCAEAPTCDAVHACEDALAPR